MLQTGTKEIQKQASLAGEDDPLRIVQETVILPYWQMVYAQTKICPWKWNA